MGGFKGVDLDLVGCGDGLCKEKSQLILPG